MKRIMNIYESCRISIRVAFIGFIFIGFGYLIQNESVNIFYTFRNAFLLLLADGMFRLGQEIIINLPIIFMLNIVCKKANSAFPVVLALVGYFSFLITTSLFAPTNLASTAYSSNLSNILNVVSSSKTPLESGMIASFVVAYITRFSFVRSRHRSTLSILGFFNKDTAGLIYNIVFCSVAGIVFSFTWPFVFEKLQSTIVYIGEDLMDPYRLGLYGVLDRSLSILGMPNIMRQPFWYTSLGGSYQAVSGQSIVGDVNIYNYIKDLSTSYSGAGRFITPYYLINLFIVPAIIVGSYVSLNDKESKFKLMVPMIGFTLLSIACGNPLPMELLLLFTSPLLLVFYLMMVGTAFFTLTSQNVYMGSSIKNGLISTSMPGSFPDYIINIRSSAYSPIIYKIFVIGLVFFVVMLIITVFYFRFLAYDLTKTGKTTDFSNKIIEAVGGKENIKLASAGYLRLCLDLADLEKVDISKIQQLEIRRVMETKNGIDIECGSSAYMIAKRINFLRTH